MRPKSQVAAPGSGYAVSLGGGWGVIGTPFGRELDGVGDVRVLAYRLLEKRLQAAVRSYEDEVFLVENDDVKTFDRVIVGLTEYP